MRQYLIHVEQSATWLLVSSEGVCRWHVERLGPQGERAKFDIPTFEKSSHGQKLAAKLAGALMEAQQDA